MFPFFRPKDVEDLQEKLRGKSKRYRLTRNSGTLSFTGKLLSLFRRDDNPDALCPPVIGCVEMLAVFATRAGRFLIFYVVLHPHPDQPLRRQEYAHICPDLPALRDFLAAMAYANKACFLERVLAEAGWQPAVSPEPVAETPALAAPAAPLADAAAAPVRLDP